MLVSVTLAGINLATIGMPDVDGIPNPAVVLMMSLLAGAVGNEIIKRIKAAAGALFNAQAPPPPPSPPPPPGQTVIHVSATPPRQGA